jgi:hypothetical protein
MGAGEEPDTTLGEPPTKGQGKRLRKCCDYDQFPVLSIVLDPGHGFWKDLRQEFELLLAKTSRAQIVSIRIAPTWLNHVVFAHPELAEDLSRIHPPGGLGEGEHDADPLPARP